MKNIANLKQGDIIKVDFNPIKGNEQANYRPAVIVSNDIFNKRCQLFMVCPITNTDNGFPMHIPLNNTKISGFVLCEHLRTLDLKNRGFSYVEPVSADVLEEVLDIVGASIEFI